MLISYSCVFLAAKRVSWEALRPYIALTRSMSYPSLQCGTLTHLRGGVRETHRELLLLIGVCATLCRFMVSLPSRLNVFLHLSDSSFLPDLSMMLF